MIFSYRYDSTRNFDLDFQQAELNSQYGAYIEEIANIQIYHSEWSFVTFVNLSYFAIEMDYLNETVTSIQMLCDSINNEFSILSIQTSYCDHTMPQLHNLLEEIKDFDINWFLNHGANSLHPNPFNRSERKKRSILGTISKRLFFSLSEDDAEFYRNQIGTLKTENVDRILFARNQTTLFQETLKVLNNTMQSQIVQHTALQKQFDDVENLLNNSTASSTLNGKLGELMQYTTFLMTKFWQKQRYIFDLITTKSKNFHLIPPKLFINELKRIEPIIAKQRHCFPLPINSENLSTFFQLTTIEGRIVDNNLLLRFSIPLVEMDNFHLYKIISAPHRNQNNEIFSFIIPHHEYIAFDIQNEKFITLTRSELQSCHRINTQNLICRQSFPILKANNNAGCEINLIRNTNVTDKCDVRASKLTEEIWIKLQQTNTYLYTLPKTQTVAIVCPHSQTKLQLHDTGIITLSPKCKIKTEQVEIIAFQTIESIKSYSFKSSPKFNATASINGDIEKIKHTKSLSNPKLPDHKIKDDINHLTKIHDSIDDLQIEHMINKASVINSFNLKNDDHINPILLLIITIAFIALIILIITICFKYCAVPGCHIIIFIIVMALTIPWILFFL